MSISQAIVPLCLFSILTTGDYIQFSGTTKTQAAREAFAYNIGFNAVYSVLWPATCFFAFWDMTSGEIRMLKYKKPYV